MRILQTLNASIHWPTRRLVLFLSCLFAGLACNCGSLLATDYFLTIGGGYNPSGNQASLEANVLFVQTILAEQPPRERVHEIFFADGTDSAADLQVLKSSNRALPPATEFLASLHRRGGGSAVEYRNHKVPNISGPTDPELIRAVLAKIATQARTGDRLVVYVTSHGSEARGRDPYNTTIDCWDNKAIKVRDFATWLESLPPDVPVLMVMAQCYCGGFARAIFEEMEGTPRLAKQVRTGFFAQQHNLPAAGCRPDISNDEEFSSYFWGAIAGRSRTGVPITACDVDGDGTISFAEAYAYAVVASPTIDIPLRASDVLLRTYSRLPGDLSKTPTEKEAKAPTDSPAVGNDENRDLPATLSALMGTLNEVLDGGHSVSRKIVTDIAKELGFSPQDDVKSMTTAYDELRRKGRTAGRGARRRNGPGAGGRPGAGRRELLEEIGKKWPELADPKNWERSPLLKAENQKELMAELEKMPGFEVYEERRRQRADSSDKADQNELREIKFRRLIDTLEVVVLAKNLPHVATPEIVKRYAEMTALENSSLTPQEK